MADARIGITIQRSDRAHPDYDKSLLIPDVDSAEGGDKTVAIGGTEVNLWTSTYDASGSAFTAEPFNSLAVFVDPDLSIEDEEHDIGGWIKVYTTPIAGGASAANTYLERVTRRHPFMLSSAMRGTTTTATRAVTKIGFLNDDTVNPLPIRTLVQ